MERTTPDLKGDFARAWKLPLPESHPTIAGYLVHAPYAHPFWGWYTMAVIHLRPVEGLPPAAVSLPGATHELAILAIDPRVCPEPTPEMATEGQYPFLMPPDVMEQFMVLDDQQAVSLLENCVQAVVQGRISPDSDFRSRWAKVIANTSEHYRLGGHPDGCSHSEG